MEQEKEFWTIQQIADLFKLRHETVRRWIIKKRLPAIKVGGSWRISNEVMDKVLSGTLVINP